MAKNMLMRFSFGKESLMHKIKVDLLHLKVIFTLSTASFKKSTRLPIMFLIFVSERKPDEQVSPSLLLSITPKGMTYFLISAGWSKVSTFSAHIIGENASLMLTNGGFKPVDWFTAVEETLLAQLSEASSNILIMESTSWWKSNAPHSEKIVVKEISSR